jgi:hypothetical protein
MVGNIYNLVLLCLAHPDTILNTMLNTTTQETSTNNSSAISQRAKDDLHKIINEFLELGGAAYPIETLSTLLTELFNTDEEDKDFTQKFIIETVGESQRIILFLVKLQEAWNRYQLFCINQSLKS